MRVNTFHRHSVSRSSTFLGSLLTVHVPYSLMFSMPVFYSYVGQKWNLEGITHGQRATMLSIILLWSVTELFRFYSGFNGNTRHYLGAAITFLCLSVVPQVALMAVYASIAPRRNDLEYSVCVVQLILLCFEILGAIRLVMRLARNTTVDFYVKAGVLPAYSSQ